jgi:hypothetical protein
MKKKVIGIRNHYDNINSESFGAEKSSSWKEETRSDGRREDEKDQDRASKTFMIQDRPSKTVLTMN